MIEAENITYLFIFEALSTVENSHIHAALPPTPAESDHCLLIALWAFLDARPARTREPIPVRFGTQTKNDNAINVL